MSEQEKLIQGFEEKHSGYFSPEYRALLLQTSAEHVQSKLAECREWFEIGGKIEI